MAGPTAATAKSIAAKDLSPISARTERVLPLLIMLALGELV